MSNHTIFNQEGQHVGTQYNAAGDMYISPQSAPPQVLNAPARSAYMAPIRRALTNAFDDVGLESFCLDYFEAVYDQFTRGMHRNEKINLLLNHCRRSSGFAWMLQAVQQEITFSPLKQKALAPLVRALQTYLKVV